MAAALLFMLCGCGKFTALPEDVEAALEKSGDNWEELFSVISHYRDSGDTVKLKAAEFIIGNMKEKYFYDGKQVDMYHHFMDSLFNTGQETYDVAGLARQYYEQNGGGAPEDGMEICHDVKTLKASYVIDNIEHAFKAWRAPWNKSLGFDDFCEFLLPYRTGTERPGEWREPYAEEFAGLVSSDSTRSAIDACISVNKYLINKKIKIIPGAISPIELMPGSLQKMTFGKCTDCARLAVYAMRSAGIPASMCVIPHWGTKNGGHSFNVLKGDGEQLYDFLGTEAQPGHHLEMFHDSVPKVYMTTYGKQASSLAVIGKGEDIPDFFKNPYIKDVTGKIRTINTTDISMPVVTDERFVYLCVFDITGWVPVAWGTAENGNVTFDHIGTGVVYQMATYSNSILHPHGFPFLVNNDGGVRYFKPGKHTFAYTLERKNPESNSWEGISRQVIGGVFQGACQRDFSDAVTYYEIDKEPPLKFITVTTHDKRPVRYIRYRSSAGTYGNMGEVEFYTPDSGTPLRGKVYGCFQPSKYFPDNGAEKLFDGDPLTFFHTSDSLSWGAMELDRPASISKIRFIIRNDDNGIRKGHEYELFYASDSCWKSLGRRTATRDDGILYTGLPGKALFWLRDYTKGHEERIFEISDGGNVVWH